MTILTSTVSFRKYDSAELSRVDISSPKTGRGPCLWGLCGHGETVWKGRLRDHATAAINDTNGYLNSLFLIGHSWCVGPSIFLAWRIAIFVYMVVTITILSLRSTFATAAISMGIYFAQVLASFFAVLSSTFVILNLRNEATCALKERITWPQERLQDQKSRIPKQLSDNMRARHKGKEAITRAVNILALLFIQNCCALVLFWNIVFWLRVDEHGNEILPLHSTDMLLHFYNLIPLLFESVIGCAVFKLAYYLPGTLIVVFILARISSASFRNLDVPHVQASSVWSASSEWLVLVRLLQMLLIYISACFFAIVTQKARQRLIRGL